MSEKALSWRKQRALEKQAAREEDERLIREGRATAKEINERNAAFAFPRERLIIKLPKRLV